MNTQQQINEIEQQINETIGDAGRYWQYCDSTRRSINLMRQEIEQIKARCAANENAHD